MGLKGRILFAFFQLWSPWNLKTHGLPTGNYTPESEVRWFNSKLIIKITQLLYVRISLTQSVFKKRPKHLYLHDLLNLPYHKMPVIQFACQTNNYSIMKLTLIYVFSEQFSHSHFSAYLFKIIFTIFSTLWHYTTFLSYFSQNCNLLNYYLSFVVIVLSVFTASKNAIIMQKKSQWPRTSTNRNKKTLFFLILCEP